MGEGMVGLMVYACNTASITYTLYPQRSEGSSQSEWWKPH